MVVVPAATPVTFPELSTVATPVFKEVHGVVPFGVPDPVNVIVDVPQISLAPDKVGTLFTVTVVVVEHPASFVYVIVVVPAETAVTTPLASTVATVPLDDVHGLVAFGVPDPVSADVEPLHKVVTPLIVGRAFTVTVTVF